MRNILFGFVICFVGVLGFSSALECSSSSDDYAVEVLINKPETNFNLDVLSDAINISIIEDSYVYRSRIDSNVYVILNPSEEDNGVLARFQLPTKLVNDKIEKVEIFSDAVISMPFENLLLSSAGFTCRGKSCSLKLPNVSVSLNELANTHYSVDVSLYNLKEQYCSSMNPCYGYCLPYQGKTVCIGEEYANIIGDIFSRSKITRDFDSFVSIASVSFGIDDTSSIIPDYSGTVDWKEVVKGELENLRFYSIIQIGNEDIERISEISDAGKAGSNNMIIWGEDENNVEKWIYANKAKNYFPTKETNECTATNLPSFVSYVIFEEKSDSWSILDLPTYYLVPVILTMSLFFILIVLVVVARIISIERRPRKSRENDSELTAG